MLPYFLGLLIFWIKNKGQKSFHQISSEKGHFELRAEAISFLLKLVAGLGAIFMLLVVIYLISAVVWKGIQKLF